MIVDDSEADNEADLLLGLFKYLSRKYNNGWTIRLYMLLEIKNNKMTGVKNTGNIFQKLFRATEDKITIKALNPYIHQCLI